MIRTIQGEEKELQVFNQFMADKFERGTLFIHNLPIKV
jgi:hypothetical protein